MGYGSQRCNENQAWFDNSYSGHRDNAATTNLNVGSYPLGVDGSSYLTATAFQTVVGFAPMRTGSWCSHVADVTSQPYDRTYSEWDANKAYACKCDGGFYGLDCSSRYCPKGDDPLTVGHEHGYQPTTPADASGITGADCSEWVGFPAYDATFKACWTHFQFYDHDTSDDDEIQLVTISAPADFESTTDNDVLGFGLVYTDLYGGVWETCNITQCTTGCSPWIAGIRGKKVNASPSTVHCHVQELWKGEDEAAECSNRGICDSKSGLCECFTGHTDEDCSEMTALI